MTTVPVLMVTMCAVVRVDSAREALEHGRERDAVHGEGSTCTRIRDSKQRSIGKIAYRLSRDSKAESEPVGLTMLLEGTFNVPFLILPIHTCFIKPVGVALSFLCTTLHVANYHRGLPKLPQQSFSPQILEQG